MIIEDVYQDLLIFENGIGSTCVSHNGTQLNIDFKKMKERGKKKKIF